MRRVMRFATVTATAVLLAACGGDGDTGGEGGDGGGTVTLTTIDNAFQPATLTVAAGAELELTNDGQAEHNFSIEGTDVSQDVDPGGRATVSVDVDPGEYTMFCEYHRASGMEGTVTVQ
jgi:plastocyanin